MSITAADDLIFKALAHYRRREILDFLKQEPRTTGAICDRFGDMDRCTVMQHLGVLEDADLIIVQRAGRERWNALNSMPIQKIHDRWISRYATHALSIIGRLKSDLEGSADGSAQSR